MLELVDVLQRLEAAVSTCTDKPPLFVPKRPSSGDRDGGAADAMAAPRRTVALYRERLARRAAADAVRSVVVNVDEKGKGTEDVKCDHLEQEANALREIISVFGENRGAALIDEVDWILHPLKSELNFPIGQNVSAELSPERWELPLFVLEAVFFAQTGELSLADGPKLVRESSGSRVLLDQIISKLQLGARLLALQDRPKPRVAAP